MFHHSFLPTRHETANVRSFADLANQKKEFIGVQSNLQSNFNYRSKNMRLEVKFLKKSVKIKDILLFLDFQFVINMN